MYHVYILFSPLKNRYYVGFTSEPPLERLRRHNTNHSGFTGKLGDWTIVHTEIYPEKEQAMQREKQIKSWKSRKMIEKLINQTDLEHSDQGRRGPRFEPVCSHRETFRFVSGGFFI